MSVDRIVRVRSGQLLASLRRSAELSQAALGEHAGITRGAISHLESGRNGGISRGRAAAIARALDVPVHVLFIVPKAAETDHARTRRSIGDVAARADRSTAAAAAVRR